MPFEEHFWVMCIAIVAPVPTQSNRARANFFIGISEHAGGKPRGVAANLTASKDASRRDFSDAALRSVVALGVRPLHAPEKRDPLGRRAVDVVPTHIPTHKHRLVFYHN